MRTRDAVLTSFDGTECQQGKLARPERYRDLIDLVGSGINFIPRGAGLSYSAASMADGTMSMDMTRFDRLLSFNPETGDVVVEPGITVGALTDFLASRGFSLPVVPGYPDITVGGCVAFDVHGKSQFHSGNFGQWVTEIRLFHPAHGELTCNPTLEHAVFDLTLGGMGLTGLVTRVALRTIRLGGRAVELSAVAVDDLGQASQLMQARADNVDCLYSWHNLNRRGRRFGAGVVFLERYVDGPPPKYTTRRRRFAMGRHFPAPLWNRVTTGLALSIYERLQGRGRSRVLALHPALFPIEGLEGYYAAFGRRGFREAQLIVPFAEWSHFVEGMERTLERISVPVTLCSLKLFKGGDRYLSFTGSGICLALDVPATPAALAFFSELDRLAVLHGARVNLSKDSRVSEDLCRRIFPQYETFRSELRHFDPQSRVRSRLRDRIGV
jgi:decaprenylphospho-beta-D-ribofuranose 2-oxidase